MKLKFVGIDVSKKTLDICILEEKKELFKIKNEEKIFANSSNKELKTKILNTTSVSKIQVNIQDEQIFYNPIITRSKATDHLFNLSQ